MSEAQQEVKSTINLITVDTNSYDEHQPNLPTGTFEFLAYKASQGGVK